MPAEKLNSCTTLELLIELMYAGKSGIVPELASEEPVSVDEVVRILEARTSQRLGTSFEAWNEWYQSLDDPASSEDRATLQRLKDFKDKSDPLFKRARDRLDQ